ncbi:hypothetical protein B5G28_08595 [Faecalibacterium sp. An77]|uniref:sigma-70 family RNA polymerase sigma factor n=1 Tax=Faecalibacterium sp. An77 TaxID=1965655 RepID=UPI000B389C4A|nr:sigma-70 family RNA polymerase sigma factor [Faecalibacterium sp. An77]OUN38642.1 hypothetical protein B5G28_08595 [Faecalibacterium sp. An77]
MNTNAHAKTPDQQECNKTLAALAAAGDRSALGQLWEINRWFLVQKLGRWYRKNRDTAQAHGLTMEDLKQEGFFAVQYAAEHYSPEKGSFTTFLAIAVKRQISLTIRGDHSMSVTMGNGRQAQISANPLNSCTSLDAPLSADDEDGYTLAGLLPDPAASAEFEAAEADIYIEELHAVLEDAMKKLSQNEIDVIRCIYWEGHEMTEIATDKKISRNRIEQIKHNALNKLARNLQIRRFADASGSK